MLPNPTDLQDLAHKLVSSADFLGYLACALVLLTFCMQAMLPLRLVALCSNIAFIAYGWSTRLMPIFILHCLLALINALSISHALFAHGSNEHG